MKQITLLILSLALIYSCKNSTESGKVMEETMAMTPDTAAAEDYSRFEQKVGQLPSEAGLMQIPDLQQRISNMLKNEYGKFQKDWNVETPLEMEDRILFTTGCQQSDCKANRYLLFLDLTTNDINIINFSYGKVRSWEEGAIIGLPSGFLKKFEEIRKEQGL